MFFCTLEINNKIFCILLKNDLNMLTERVERRVDKVRKMFCKSDSLPCKIFLPWCVKLGQKSLWNTGSVLIGQMNKSCLLIGQVDQEHHWNMCPLCHVFAYYLSSHLQALFTLQPHLFICLQSNKSLKICTSVTYSTLKYFKATVSRSRIMYW